MPFEVEDPSEGGDFGEDKEEKAIILLPRGVAGTTVCVDVVEMEDEDDEDSAGEHERGDRDPDVDGNDDEVDFDSSLDACARV